MKTRTLGAVGLVLGLSAALVHASSIGVFFDATATDCDATVVPVVPFTTYVIAQLYGDAAENGITGAEFRLDGIDPAWINTVTPSPAASISLGSPITGGCNIAFPACERGDGNGVLLYTIQSVSLTGIQPRILLIGHVLTPVGPPNPCPQVTLCDEPQFTKLCVSGGFAALNASCDFAVEGATWSQVKHLYNH